MGLELANIVKKVLTRIKVIYASNKGVEKIYINNENTEINKTSIPKGILSPTNFLENDFSMLIFNIFFKMIFL